MEFYQNLNWSRKQQRNPAERIKFYDFNFSDDETDTFYQQLNQIDSIHLKCMINNNDDNASLPIDPRTKAIVPNIIVDCQNQNKLEFFKYFPAQSLMQKPEHVVCIRAIAKMFSGNKIDLSIENVMDQQLYTSLKAKRLKERELFQQFVTDYCNAHLITRFLSVEPTFEAFVERYRRSEIESMRSRDGNKDVYCLQTAIPRVSLNCGDFDVELKMKQILKQKGIVPQFILLYGDKYTQNVKTQRDHVRRIGHSNVPLICQDEVVRELVAEQECEVVATVKGLRCLLDSTIQNWSIHVSIEEIDGHHVIFIDKPLPPLECNGMRKNQRATKCALKLFTLFPEYGSSWCYDSNMSVKQITDAAAESKKAWREAKTDTPDKEIPWALQPIDEYLENLNIPFEKLASSKNQTYSLWEIGDAAQNFSMIVRTKQDGRERGLTSKIHQFVNLSAKLEFCSEFGAQKMSQQELIREWLRQYFRPSSVTKRVRIDATTSYILSQKTLSLSQIEVELERNYAITPKKLFQDLFGKLKIMTTFPPGEYILEATEKNPDVIHVYMKKDGVVTSQKAIFTIENYLNCISFEKKIESIVIDEIDDTEVTILHRQATVMPGAFPHQPYNYNKKKKGKQFLNNEKNYFNEKRKKIHEEKQEKLQKKIEDTKIRQKHNKNARKKQKEKEKRRLLEIEKLKDAKYDYVDSFDDTFTSRPTPAKISFVSASSDTDTSAASDFNNISLDSATLTPQASTSGYKASDYNKEREKPSGSSSPFETKKKSSVISKLRNSFRVPKQNKMYI